jgi:RNA polymerase sigma factor (sigma-70 family)
MDPQLIVRAQRGDERAFADLTSAIGGRLSRAAYGILRDRDLAEDAMQAALIQIWRKLPGLRDPARFDAWSYRILIHACYREAKRVHRGALGFTADSIEQSDGFHAVLDRDELEHAFRRLSLDQRTIVVLRLYLDLSPEVVARTLDIPVGTVHSRLHRALDVLRSSLEADARPVSAVAATGGAYR